MYLFYILLHKTCKMEIGSRKYHIFHFMFISLGYGKFNSAAFMTMEK